jgi:orotidine-5'-phosphate decarboxylase
VVPGIREPADSTGDQRRTVTAAEAVRLGATHLVVGRHLTGATDPSGMYQRLMASL